MIVRVPTVAAAPEVFPYVTVRNTVCQALAVPVPVRVRIPVVGEYEPDMPPDAV